MKFVTYTDAARITGVSHSVIRRMALAGAFPRRTIMGRLVVRLSDLDYIRAQKGRVGRKFKYRY